MKNLNLNPVEEQFFQHIHSLLEGLASAAVAHFTATDFGTAEYNYFDIEQQIPKQEVKDLVIESERLRKALSQRFGREKNPPSLEKVIRELLAKETSLPVGNDERAMYVCMGQTRDSLGRLFEYLADDGRPVAIPLPSWHFWGNSSSRFCNFAYFDGSTEAELVENFDVLTRTKDIGALVLSSPSTPLGLEFSEATVKEIDEIASKRDVAVIVDEVLRGNKPVGNKDSIGRWVRRPYVVEGLAHRLGSQMAPISYILFPDKKVPKSFSPPDRVYSAIAAIQIAADLKYASQPAFEDIKRRNQEFDKGFAEISPQGVEITRPHEGSLTSVIKLPECYPLTGKEFSTIVRHHGIVVPSMEVYHPQNYRVAPHLLKSLRVSVGKMPAESQQIAANFLAQAIQGEARIRGVCL